MLYRLAINALVGATVLALALLSPRHAAAEVEPYHPGIMRLSVDGRPAALVWYPTDVAPSSIKIGPFDLMASFGSPLAQENARYPVVLISHGRGAGPLSHRSLGMRLARSGYVVVGLAHTTTDSSGPPRQLRSAESLANRSLQAKSALDALLTDPRFSGRIDEHRLGVIGFSLGGSTALALGGAVPNFAAAADYCSQHPEDAGSCDGLFEAREGEELGIQAHDPRIKAIALLDPAAVFFDQAGLARNSVPILLAMPSDDRLMHRWPNASAIARALERRPIEIVLPGQHFVFVDPCPDDSASRESLICRDPVDVDRREVQRTLSKHIVEFFRSALPD